MTNPTTFYCIKTGDPRRPYRGFSRSEMQASMHGKGEVIKVVVRESVGDEVPTYWAWYDTKNVVTDELEEKFSTMVFPSKSMVEICFYEGVEEAEARGRGRMLQVVIEEAK